jgi:hypothetical protein
VNAEQIIKRLLEDDLDWSPETSDPDDRGVPPIMDYAEELPKLGFIDSMGAQGHWHRNSEVADHMGSKHVFWYITVWPMSDPEVAIMQVGLHSGWSDIDNCRLRYWPLEYAEMLRRIKTLIADLDGRTTAEIRHYLRELNLAQQ